MTTDVFVGRERELQRLVEALDEALAGLGGVVWITGEPGVGKTRLAREFERYTPERGAVTVWGRANETAGAPAFWPWTQALRALVQEIDVDVLRNALPREASEVARLVPALRDRLPEVPAPEPPADAGSAQFRLLDAVTSFLARVAESQPLVVVLDDVHWADKETLLLLEHAALELAEARVVLVGAYRDVELGRQHPLADAVAAIARAERVQTINLRGLSAAEVTQYVHAAAGVQTPEAESIASIYRQTEGNAFFLQAVVALMMQEEWIASGRVAIPQSVRATIRHRLNKLSEDCNALLQVAAVVGREFSEVLLAALSPDADQEHIPGLLDAALSAGLIEEAERAGEYRFTHALIQETLLDEVRAVRRVSLHGRIAEALETRVNKHGEVASELAYHFAESASLTPEHRDRAAQYSDLAGQYAEERFAWTDAARHFTAALELESSPGSIPSAELLFRAGRASRNAGSYRVGWGYLMRALDQFREQRDRQGVALAALEATRLVVPAQRLLPVLQQSLAFLDEGEPTPVRVRLMVALAECSSGEERRQLLEDTESRAAQLGLRDVLARIRSAQAQDAMESDLDRAIALLEEAHSLVRGQDWVWRHPIFGALAERYIAAGRLDDALRISDEYLGLAQRDHLAMDLEDAVDCAFQVHSYRGQYERCRQVIELLPSSCVWKPAYEAALRLRTGGPDEGLLETFPPSDDPRFAASHRALNSVMAARVAFAAGDEREARDRLSRAIGESEYLQSGYRHGWLAVAAEIACRMGSYELIDAFYQELRDHPESRLASGALLTSVDYARGLLALALGQPGEAKVWFERGIELCQRERCVVETGRCHLGLAEAAAVLGNNEAARIQVDHAITAFTRCGARVYLEQALSKQLELAAMTPAGRSLYPDGLSEREVEVLRLIAAGRSNQQIADALVISPATVARHVSNILGKTGLANRTEAAGYALRHALLA